MKILFLTPSLEERGGVSDYTLRLAGALRESGNNVRCVSLNERRGVFAKGGDRMSVIQPWKERVKSLQGILDEFLPDIVSLQFVPYGFQSKGLPIGLPDYLGCLKGAFRWHVMFHELWIGEEDHYTLFQRATGWLQRSIISRLASLKPVVVHTSNPEYLSRLQNIGFSARELPLFGNIPVSEVTSGIRPSLRLNASPALQSHEDPWIFAIFGGIHPGWDMTGFLRSLRSARLRAGKSRCLFMRLGKGGKAGEEIWRAMQRIGGSDFSFFSLGESAPEIISQHLQVADFGIMTTPLHLMGKSGSAVAMREHGLPIIAVRVEQSASEYPGEGIILMDQDFEIRMSQSQKLPPCERLASVAERFLADLSQAE